MTLGQQDFWKRLTGMPKKGFQVVWLGLPKKTETDVKKFLKKRCPKKHFREIFRKFTGFDKVEEMDTKRLHLENFDKDMGEKMWFLHLKKTVEEQLQCIHEDMEVKYWSVLWSTKGCKRQTTHQDFGDNVLNYPILAGIVSFDDSTTLDIDEPTHVKLSLPSNYMVVFRGDLEHSGSAYEVSNKRIYFKAAPKNIDLMEDLNKHGSGEVALAKFDCKGVGCTKRFHTSDENRNHRWHCVFIHGEETIQKRKKAKNEYSRKRRASKKMEETTYISL